MKDEEISLYRFENRSLNNESPLMVMINGA